MGHILTDMKKILVVLDDELAKGLEGSANKSETIRNALRVYNEHILTDTVGGLRQSYKVLLKRLEEIDKKQDERYVMVERLIKMIEERFHT